MLGRLVNYLVFVVVALVLFFLSVSVRLGGSFLEGLGGAFASDYSTRGKPTKVDHEIENASSNSLNFLFEGMGRAFRFVKDESRQVVEQMIANTVTIQLDRIDGFNYVSNSKFLKSVGLQQGMEIQPEDSLRLRDYLSQYPWIESYTITTDILPQRMRVHVVEAKPWLVTEYHGESWLLSTKGALLEPLRMIENVDLIKRVALFQRLYGLDREASSGSLIAELSEKARLHRAVTILESIELAGGMPFPWDIVTLQDDGSLTFEPRNSATEEEGEFYLSEVKVSCETFEQAKDMISQLTLVEKDLLSRGEMARGIDLRYQGQVIVY